MARADILTFDEALKRALDTAVALKGAANDKALAAQRKELGTYEDDLTLSLQSSYAQRYRDLADNAPSGQDEVTGEQSYGISVAVPLFDFGRTTSRQKQLDLELQAAGIAEQEALADLHFQVARLYLAVSAALRLEAVSAEQVKIADARVAEQTRLYRQGLRPETDVLAARVGLGEAQLTHQQAQDEVLTARIHLANLIGANENDAVEDMQLPQLDIDPGRLRQFIQSLGTEIAPGSLPSEQRRQLERDALSAELAGLQANRRPTIAAALGAEGVGTVSPVRPQASASIQLEWEIPWSGMGRDNEQLNALQRQALTIASQEDLRQRQGQWLSARHSLQAAQRSAASLAEQFEIVKRQQQLVQQSYNSGRATAFEVSTVEAAVLSLRLNLARVAQQAVEAAIDAAEAKGTAALSPLFAALGPIEAKKQKKQ